MESVERRDKPKDYKKVLRGLMDYLRPQKKLLIIGYILMLSSNTIALLGPYFSGKAIDYIGENANFPMLVRYALLMAGAYILSAILIYFFMRLVNRLAQRTTAHMRRDTYNKIVDLPISYIDTHHAGDLVSRISYDLSLVNQSIAGHFFQVQASAVVVLGSLIMMISISRSLSLLFILLLPVTVAFTVYRVKKSRPLFSKRSKLLGKMNAYVEEILYGQSVISSYGKEEYFSSEFEKVNKESMDAYYQAEYQASINGPSISFITNLSLAFIAMFGGMLYIRGEVSLGTLTAFILYSRRFSGPINEIAQIITEIQSALSAGERVFNLLDEPKEAEDRLGAKPLEIKDGRICFEDIDFSYTKDKEIIKNFNLEVEPQSLTAIVGPTGAGKSTIINLLMRFYDPNDGKILIDGQDITEVQRESLRESFAMVLQDSWLFKGSLRENIAYANPDVSDEEVMRVIEAANLEEYLESQPDGLDSIVADGGANLSQGQRQLVSIARAMLVDAPFLILDEATSNVDSKTEIQIQEAMKKLSEGRTSIVIAHRLSTIQNADKIVVLADGEIQEMGRHQELLDQGGFYSDLYRAQFT